MKVIRTAAIIVGAVVAAVTIVGAVAGVAAGVGIAAGVSAAAGAIGLSAAALSTIGLVAGLVASGAQMAIGPPKPSVTGSPLQFKLDPQAPVPYIIGRAPNAGNIVHRVAFGPELNAVENPFQIFVSVASVGPIDGLDGFSVDQAAVTFDGSGATTTAAYMREADPFMWMKSQNGALPEASALSLPSPVNIIPQWGASSKLSGLAAYIWGLRFNKQGKIYASGVPQPLPVWRGVKVYDPRLDSTYPGGSGGCRPLEETTYVYSRNPWLHALTLALGRWQNGKKVLGIGMALAAINVPAFVEAANVADANGWTANGVISSADEPWNALKMLGQAGGGEPIRLGGKLSCIVKAPRVSLGTITSADLIGKGSVVGTQARRDRINGVVPRIRSEDHQWEVVPLEAVRPSTYVAEDGGERTREVDYQLVTDKDQAAELAAYDIVDAREFGPITLPLKIRCLGYKPGDCLTLDIPELGLNAQDAIVTGRSLDPASGTVTLIFKSETAAKHDFALGRTGVAPPTPGLTPPDITDVPAPSASDWAATGGVVESDGGEKVPALFIIGGPSVGVLDSVIFEYRKVGDTAWTVAGTDEPAAEMRKEVTGLPGSTAYQCAVSYVVRGVTGARLVLGPVTTGQWTIIGDLDARLSLPTVQLPASFAGVVSDYSPAQGEWVIKAGGTDVTELFDYSVGANPGTLDVTLVGGAYAVTGGFDPEDDIAMLTLHAQGQAGSGFELASFDRQFQLTKIRAPYAVDTVPPATPSGLVLNSVLRTDSDGTQKVWLIATWNANADADLNRYRLLLREAGGNFVRHEVGGTRFEVPVLGGVTYEAQLQAIDHSGNVSNTFPTPPAVISHTAAADTTVPGVPTGVLATATFQSIFVTWNNDAAADLQFVEVWENATNSSGSATRIATVFAEAGKPGMFTRQNLATGTQRFYWLKSVDTSGNTSGFSSGVNATTGKINATNEIVAGSVTTNLVTAFSLNGDRITAGTLNANAVFVSGNATKDALATGITIGVSGTTIGTVDTRANDPIARANAKTTQLAPGLVLISGTTTIADWRYGPDNTLINGGRIGANSISANVVHIGQRGIEIAGLEFTANWNGTTNSGNSIAWTAGTISYVNDAGTPTTVNVAAGTTFWPSATTLYMVWIKGATSVSWGTDVAYAHGADAVVLATYRGGTDMVVNYGRTIIDGDHITTNTVNANILIAGTISSRELATTTLISVSSQLGDAVVSTLKIAGASIFAPVPFSFSDVLLPNTGAEQTIGTTGTVTIGDSAYGSALITVQGQYDGTIDDDSGQAIHVEVSLNGGAWTRYATTKAGSKVTSGAGYAYQSVCQTYSVSGVGLATLQARLVAGAIAMPGRSLQRSYFREGKIIVGPGKR